MPDLRKFFAPKTNLNAHCSSSSSCSSTSDKLPLPLSLHEENASLEETVEDGDDFSEKDDDGIDEEDFEDGDVDNFTEGEYEVGAVERQEDSDSEVEEDEEYSHESEVVITTTNEKRKADIVSRKRKFNEEDNIHQKLSVRIGGGLTLTHSQPTEVPIYSERNRLRAAKKLKPSINPKMKQSNLLGMKKGEKLEKAVKKYSKPNTIMQKMDAFNKKGAVFRIGRDKDLNYSPLECSVCLQFVRANDKDISRHLMTKKHISAVEKHGKKQKEIVNMASTFLEWRKGKPQDVHTTFNSM